MGSNERSIAIFKLAKQAMPAMELEFGPESRARKLVLRELAKRNTLICYQCNFENKIPRSDVRMFLCKKCRKEIWVTARTAYHKVTLFFPRLATIRLYEMGICINANHAVRLFHISSGTAGLIVKTASIIAASRLPDTAYEVPSQYSISIVCRRTTQTPAQMPPYEEEFALQREEGRNGNFPDSESDNLHMPKMTELELLIFEILSDTPIDFEQLVLRTNEDCGKISAALTLLELSGSIESCPGSKFKRANSIAIGDSGDDEKLASLVESFNHFIKDHFQGIGRKYIQLYSMLYWLAFDRQTWQINSLRKLFISHPHVSYQDILDYVTPLSFKLVPRRFDTS